jgi:hypothetical protein
MNEIPLPKQFTDRGFTLSEEWREGDVAMYRRQRIGGKAVTWEVYLVRHNKAFEIGGNHVPAKESVPSPEQWGTYAWTFTTAEAARHKFTSLTADSTRGRFTVRETHKRGVSPSLATPTA